MSDVRVNSAHAVLSPAQAPGPLDERAPYEAAESVVRVIARLSPRGLSEADVWQMIFSGVGAQERQYVEAIRRTRHSIFYHQMQQLYAFGLEQAPTVDAQQFCDAVGRDYTDHVLDELLPALLQVALTRGGFQSAIMEMVRLHLGRHAGNIYATSIECSDHSIRLAIGYDRPELTGEHLAQHGLDPRECFANSFHFIAGAAQQFAGKTVQDYDPSRFRCDLNTEGGGLSGWMLFPIGRADHFAFDTLVRTLMGYIRELEAGRLSIVQETELETRLITRSPVMQETWDRIRRASLSDEIVLLCGESGTGKSFIARRIHELSLRRDKPFIEVGLTSDVGSENLVQSNLFGHEKGAFTGAVEQKHGLFKLADGGTIFLDEIADASPELQAKLLRVIEQRTFKRLGGVRDLHVDVRIISASNRDLQELVRHGRFREDLFYRLNVIPVQLPALRHRAEDVPALAQLLLSRACRRPGATRRRLTPALAARLQSYAWPGNIRELDHALKHALAMGSGDELVAEDFPPAVRAYLLLSRNGSAAVCEAGTSAGRPTTAAVINQEALRRAIRASDPVAIGSSDAPDRFPAHLAHAKRAYLEALIDELNGDLGLISLFWDHGSEKTLRKLIRDLCLTDRLKAARLNRRRRRRDSLKAAGGEP